MDFDVIIIGSGAGGGFAALNLAASQKKVLLIERGPDPYSPRPPHSNVPFKHITDDRKYDLNGSKSHLFMGDGIGGSSSIYGAVLLRPKPEDFTPGKHLSKYLHPDDYEWPVSFDEFVPYFEKIENHFNMEPFQQDNYGPPEDLAPINSAIARNWRKNGHNSGILPLAIDRKKCIKCPDCPGYVCPTEARGTTRTALVKYTKENSNLTMMTDTVALSIDHKSSTVKIKSLTDGKVKELKATKIILSAGAINSAAILLRSGFQEHYPSLGSCFMYHAGAVSFSLFGRKTEGGEKFIKQLGLDDYYFGTEDFKHKLGIFQSLPTPRAATRPVRNHLYLMMATVEDLPVPTNRVKIDSEGKPVVFHKFHKYDIYRSTYSKKLLRRLMKQAGAIGSFAVTAQWNKTHVGHQVGTIRFGRSAKTSVLDKWCRPHGMENIYVLDGGFMPTSMGASPALTIMANALRVSDYIAKSF